MRREWFHASWPSELLEWEHPELVYVQPRISNDSGLQSDGGVGRSAPGLPAYHVLGDHRAEILLQSMIMGARLMTCLT